MNKLPAGWEIKKLKDICTIQDGIHKTPKYTSKGIKFVSVENINDLYNSNKFISEEDYNKMYKIKAKKNDIFMTRIGDIGTPAILNKDEKLAYYVTLCLFTNIDEEVFNKYLYYAIQSNYFKKELYHRTLHVAFPKKINLGDIGDCKFILPPLDEQKRIASALSKIDAYLENTIKLIEEKERFKRGIAKKLLTCKEGENIPEARFKGFNDDWRKEKLSSMIKIQGGYAFKSSEFKKSGIPIIRISNISNTDNNMNMKEVVYYNEIENEKSFIIKKSDLLIALSGAPGKSSIYNLEEKAYLNQRVGLFKIIDTKKINNSFLSQYVFSSIFQNKLKPFITRGVQPNISPKDIENLDILLPSLKEQEKIGGYLSLLDKEIDNLKKQKELIKEMKKGAMQKLLSGEVRLLE